MWVRKENESKPNFYLRLPRLFLAALTGQCHALTQVTKSLADDLSLVAQKPPWINDESVAEFLINLHDGFNKSLVTFKEKFGLKFPD